MKCVMAPISATGNTCPRAAAAAAAVTPPTAPDGPCRGAPAARAQGGAHREMHEDVGGVAWAARPQLQVLRAPLQRRRERQLPARARARAQARPAAGTHAAPEVVGWSRRGKRGGLQ
jgi:hypothetical protein